MIVKTGYEVNVYAGSALLYMHAKCEIMDDAYMAFECIPEPNFVSWNAMIAGFSQLGEHETTFWLLACMGKEGALVDDGTFSPLLTLLSHPECYHITMQIHCKTVKHGMTLENTVFNAMITSYSVLTACSHMGLIEGGWNLLKTTEQNYETSPRMEHYACVVDMLGRAGRLYEAKALVESMSFKPNVMVWKTLLGACRACGNIKFGSEVASHLLGEGNTTRFDGCSLTPFDGENTKTGSRLATHGHLAIAK